MNDRLWPSSPSRIRWCRCCARQRPRRIRISTLSKLMIADSNKVCFEFSPFFSHSFTVSLFNLTEYDEDHASYKQRKKSSKDGWLTYATGQDKAWADYNSKFNQVLYLDKASLFLSFFLYFVFMANVLCCVPARSVAVLRAHSTRQLPLRSACEGRAAACQDEVL